MVTMTNLHVEGEDFFFDGDLRLLGETKIEDGSFTVTGNLILAQSYGHKYDDGGMEIISPSLEVINGNLTVGNLWTEDLNGYELDSDDDGICKNFSVVDGDIHVTNGSFNIACSNITDVYNIFIDDGDLICNDILNSFSIYVNGQIDCNDINSILDILCNTAEVHGDTICGRDLYADDYYDCHLSSLLVKGSLVTKDLRHAQDVEVG